MFSPSLVWKDHLNTDKIVIYASKLLEACSLDVRTLNHSGRMNCPMTAFYFHDKCWVWFLLCNIVKALLLYNCHVKRSRVKGLCPESGPLGIMWQSCPLNIPLLFPRYIVSCCSIRIFLIFQEPVKNVFYKYISLYHNLYFISISSIKLWATMFHP